MILFKEEGHQYVDVNGNPLESVSSFVARFKEKFADWMPTYKAIKESYGFILDECKVHMQWDDPNMIEFCKSFMTEEELLDVEFEADCWKNQWVREAQYGTDLHLEKEMDTLSSTHQNHYLTGAPHLVIKKPEISGFQNYSIIRDVLKNYRQDIVIPEALLHFDKCNCAKRGCADEDHDEFCERKAGQVDRLWLHWTGSKWIADIEDYKTDKKLDQDIFFTGEKGKKRPKMFYGPANHYPDHKRSYYTLKMNTYSLMLSEMGVTTDNLFLVHTPKSGENEVIFLTKDLHTIKKMRHDLSKRRAARPSIKSVHISL